MVRVRRYGGDHAAAKTPNARWLPVFTVDQVEGVREEDHPEKGRRQGQHAKMNCVATGKAMASSGSRPRKRRLPPIVWPASFWKGRTACQSSTSPVTKTKRYSAEEADEVTPLGREYSMPDRRPSRR